MATAAARWREDLARWAIPDEILEQAPEPPWHCPVKLFAIRADAAVSQLTVSNRKALEALPQRGTVLDVGCGAGAASLPLASRASKLIGVDSSADMLEAFLERAGSTPRPTRWPWSGGCCASRPIEIPKWKRPWAIDGGAAKAGGDSRTVRWRRCGGRARLARRSESPLGRPAPGGGDPVRRGGM